MPTSRYFAYTTSPIDPDYFISLPGLTQVGNLAISGTSFPGSFLTWTPGPDESTGYVIAYTSSVHQIAGSGGTAGVQFWRSSTQSDSSFLTLSIYISKKHGSIQNFIAATQAVSWLASNNYWTNYVSFVTSGLILNYDISNSSSYSGSGTTVTDLQGNSNATLSGSPTYSSSNGGYLTFNSGSNQSLLLNTSLNSVLSPANTSRVISFFVWVYLTGNGVIVDETSNTGWHDSQIEMVSGTLRFSVWSNGTGFASTVATPLNAWYYVGLTYDGTTLSAYVNGAAAGTAAYTRSTPYNNGGFALKYGIALADGTNLGNGGYGNFRWGAFHVYNTALSGANVLDNYNATKSRFGL